MKIADILDKAARYCERGWGQGAYVVETILSEAWEHPRRRYHYCATGAIGAVLKDYPACSEATQFLADQLRGDGNGCAENIVANWNDAPERTQPEVVAKLREAAAKAREQGL